jgi:3-oxoacyl-[acyl-carrier protein] reductase
MRLQDKVAIITGGARGIGLATARKFLDEGARVVLADREGTELGRVAAALDPGGTRVLTVAVDVTRRAQTQELAQRTVAHFGRIDILVNNAGITQDARLQNMSDEQFDRVIDVNLRGVFLVTQAVVGDMLARGAGVILNASSVVGRYGNFGQTNYAATKAGVIAYVQTWARELGPKGIRSNAVCPGFIQTPLIESVPARVLELMRERVPLRRMGLPEEVANAYAFLASDEASYINGAVLDVGGGLTV